MSLISSTLTEAVGSNSCSVSFTNVKVGDLLALYIAVDRPWLSWITAIEYSDGTSADSDFVVWQTAFPNNTANEFVETHYWALTPTALTPGIDTGTITVTFTYPHSFDLFTVVMVGCTLRPTSIFDADIDSEVQVTGTVSPTVTAPNYINAVTQDTLQLVWMTARVDSMSDYDPDDLRVVKGGTLPASTHDETAPVGYRLLIRGYKGTTSGISTATLSPAKPSVGITTLFKTIPARSSWVWVVD